MSETAFLRLLRSVHEMGEAGIPFSEVMDLMAAAKRVR
jgi:hypothetical protein